MGVALRTPQRQASASSASRTAYLCNPHACLPANSETSLDDELIIHHGAPTRPRNCPSLPLHQPHPPSPSSPQKTQAQPLQKGEKKKKKKTTTPALPTPSGSPRVTGSFVRHAPRPGGASRRQRADVPQLHGPVGRRRGGLVVAGLPDRRLLLVLRRQGIDANRLPWHSWWARKCVSAAV